MEYRRIAAENITRLLRARPTLQVGGLSHYDGPRRKTGNITGPTLKGVIQEISRLDDGIPLMFTITNGDTEETVKLPRVKVQVAVAADEVGGRGKLNDVNSCFKRQGQHAPFAD